MYAVPKPHRLDLRLGVQALVLESSELKARILYRKPPEQRCITATEK